MRRRDVRAGHLGMRLRYHDDLRESSADRASKLRASALKWFEFTRLAGEDPADGSARRGVSTPAERRDPARWG